MCGYLKLNEEELLPKGLEDSKQNEGEHLGGQNLGKLEFCLGRQVRSRPRQ